MIAQEPQSSVSVSHETLTLGPHKGRKDLTKRRRQLVLAVAKRRRKLKAMAVALLGGACQLCGYSKCIAALEFHHTDPTKKDFTVSSKGATRSWAAIEVELAKCQLVCANCHREIHSELCMERVEDQ